jgi:actin-related protein
MWLKSPIEHGIVRGFDRLEKIWHHIFSQELCIDPAEHPALVIEPPMVPKAIRERAAQVFFEAFFAPSYYAATSGAVSVLASGRTTGVAVEVGGGVSHVIPVYEGF